MATLTINSTKVKVDDSFLSLSPEQQNATVDEIAASLGAQQPPAPTTDPGFNPYDTGATKLTGGPGVAKPASLLDSTMATVNGISASVPFLQNITDAIGGGVSQLTGGDYAQYIQHQKDVREGYAKRAPLARIAGEVGGNLAAVNALGATKVGAEALGLTGNFGSRVLNSALSSGGLSIADSLSNGETGMDALQSGGVGALTGGLLPVAGAGFRAAGRGIRDNIIRPIATAANRENEVTRRLAGAIGQDTASGQRMTQGMDTLAQNAGADVVNADRFGSAIRTLARTASNISPEADNAFKGLTENRFYTQGKRAVNYVRSLMGGATDDLALQDNLRNAARQTNKTAYDAAYQAPSARAIWSPRIRQLMQAPEFLSAVRSAENAAKTDSALMGAKPVKNPFVFNPDGTVADTLAKQADGSTALPSLQFWDIVQRELRKAGEAAMRSGGAEAARPFTQLRRELLGELDGAVPAFKSARQGAAGFFGAEDAIDAGRKAFNSPKAVPEIERAVAAAKPAEREALAVGYSSEMIDAINASKDRVNVINSIFGSESARARNIAVLGPQRARELEAYVKMEQVLHQLKDAVGGNSTTAKQLIAAGLMGGGAGLGGYAASGGDVGAGLSAAALFAFGRRGLQMMGKHVDDQVMKRVAEILVSPDPKLLERAIQNASLSKAHMDAIDAIMRGLAIGAKGSAMALAN